MFERNSSKKFSHSEKGEITFKFSVCAVFLFLNGQATELIVIRWPQTAAAGLRLLFYDLRSIESISSSNSEFLLRPTRVHISFFSLYPIRFHSTGEAHCDFQFFFCDRARAFPEHWTYQAFEHKHSIYLDRRVRWAQKRYTEERDCNWSQATTTFKNFDNFFSFSSLESYTSTIIEPVVTLRQADIPGARSCRTMWAPVELKLSFFLLSFFCCWRKTRLVFGLNVVRWARHVMNIWIERWRNSNCE